jgi:hypothetical protein
MLIAVLPIGTTHSMRYAHLAMRYIDTNTRRLAAVNSIAVAAQAIRAPYREVRAFWSASKKH